VSDGAPDRSLRGVRGGAAVLLGIAALVIWPLLLFAGENTSEAVDQARHHEPFIRAYAQSWPRIALESYASATTPGYHFVLALVARAISDREIVLRLFSSLFTVALLLVVYRPAAARVGGVDGVLLALPFALSAYVVSAGAWLVTDNAGWLFALLAIASAVFASRASAGVRPAALPSALPSALAAVGATLVRQVHLWSVVPAALLLVGRSPLRRVLPAPLRAKPSRRWNRWDTLAACVLLLAPLIVAGFAWWWGGLVPPRYQGQHASGINPSAASITLALAGIFGVFFIPYFLVAGVQSRGECSAQVRTAVLGGAAGIVIWLALPTSYDVDAGRWGALWTLARHLPDVAGRSLLFLPLVPLGAIVLALGARAAWNGAGPRPTMLLLGSFAAWLAAQMANAQAWQRYCEPPVLVMLCWLAVLALSGGQADERRGARQLRRGAVLACALMQLLITLWTVHRVAMAAG